MQVYFGERTRAHILIWRVPSWIQTRERRKELKKTATAMHDEQNTNNYQSEEGCQVKFQNQV